MAMALRCSSSLCKSRNPYYFSCKLLPQARSQNFGDQGDYGKAVDANMRVLRYRIERVRMREKLNTCYKVENLNGWNYRSQNGDVQKMENFLISSFQLANIVCTNIGLVFFTGTLCIFLVSLISSSSSFLIN